MSPIVALCTCFVSKIDFRGAGFPYLTGAEKLAILKISICSDFQAVLLTHLNGYFANRTARQNARQFPAGGGGFGLYPASAGGKNGKIHSRMHGRPKVKPYRGFSENLWLYFYAHSAEDGDSCALFPHARRALPL